MTKGLSITPHLRQKTEKTQQGFMIGNRSGGTRSILYPTLGTKDIPFVHTFTHPLWNRAQPCIDLDNDILKDRTR